MLQSGPMIVYHGTTKRRALRIRVLGFRPSKKSRRVWFTERPDYARARAEYQARHAHDQPVVLTCEVELDRLRRQFGPRNVHYKGRCLAVDGALPIDILRHCPVGPRQPISAAELSEWLRHRLRRGRRRGPGPRHRGVRRLAEWVRRRLAPDPTQAIRESELMSAARRLIPELFAGKSAEPREVAARRPAEQAETAEERALAELVVTKPARRVRALRQLTELGVPDLQDWCLVCLHDRSPDVRVAALHTMLHCELADRRFIAPMARAKNARVRGAAIAALVKHSDGERAEKWMRAGLTDPSPCVRLEAAALLAMFEPARDRALFDLARYDPNPDVRRRAESLVAHKGFPKPRYRSRASTARPAIGDQQTFRLDIGDSSLDIGYSL